jgi:hypothetical protein
MNFVFRETCTNLLHKHFVQGENARSIHFIRNISQKKEFYAENSGMRCIVSTSTKGYVYDISNPQLLTEFDFTGECILSAVNSLFLFAITPAGMEVWSVLGSTRGCLLRFHPFIGLKSVCATNRKVVLLSKFSSKENVSIAAYYNQNTSETVILSDIRNIDKLSSGGKNKGSLLPIFSNWRRNRRTASNETKQNEAVEEKITYSYNIYVLDIVELCEVYEDMLEKAYDSESVDPDKYLKLLKESHSLLQSKYYDILSEEQKTQNPVSSLQLKVELSNYTLLLKKSFGLLGDVYTKLNNSDQGAFCYANSDRPLFEVFRHLQSKPPSLLLYLESILFDETKVELAQHNEEIGNEILALFKKLAPHRLSTLVLESSLYCYSRPLAASLLEQIGGEILNLPNPETDFNKILNEKVLQEYESDDLENEEEEDKMPDEAFDLNNSIQPSDLNNTMNDDGNNNEEEDDSELLTWWSDTRPKDAFALTLLLLETGETLKAVKMLSCVDANSIVEYCVAHPHLLFDNSSVTVFGSAMRNYFPWCLVEVLVRLINYPVNRSRSVTIDETDAETSVLDSTVFLTCGISLKSALTLLNNADDSLSNNRMLVERFLSAVLLTRDWSNSYNSVAYRELSAYLFNYYIEDLKEYSALLVKPETPSATKRTPRSVKSLSELNEWCTFFTYSFIDHRHQWLNEMSSIEMQEFIEKESGTVTNIRETIKQLLESNTIQATYHNIRLHCGSVYRLLYSLLNAQGLLCFIGGDHRSDNRFSVIETSRFFNETTEEDEFQVANSKTVPRRQNFRQKLSTQYFTLYQDITDQMHNSTVPFVGQLSLELVGLTATGKLEQAFEILLKLKPQLAFTFADHYCKQLHEWKYLTDRLLELLKQEQSENLVLTFDKSLWHLAKVFPPEDFLSLLPKDGNVEYFLPFINYCFSCQCSASCFDAMLDIQQLEQQAKVFDL